MDADCPFGERCSAFDGTCAASLCSDTIACGGADSCVPLERVAELREPHLMETSTGPVAYFELRTLADGQQACAIYRARVEAPRHWVVEPVVPVLSPSVEDNGCLGAPSALADREGLTLFASRGNGTAIVRARSVDGMVFAREDAPVWVPHLPWEQGWASSPAATRFSGQLVVLYEAANGRAIGMLQLDSATGLASPLHDSPWLVPEDFQDPVLWRQTDRVQSPFAVTRGDALLVYVTVHGVEGFDAVSGSGATYPADANDSIGLVSTRDLRTWERFPTGPVLARRTNLRAYLGERQPAVVWNHDDSWLVYVASDASGAQTTGLGVAQTRP